MFLYGISNGGKIAHFSSLLCDYFDLVIVDDILTDWRLHLRGHPTIHGNQNYAIYFLAPLLAEADFRELVTSVRNVTVFTRAGGALAVLTEALPTKPIDFSFASIVNSGIRSVIVEKRYDDHVAEVELTLSLLRGEPVTAKAVF